jgi:type 1 glutamine amidotransferase
MMKSKTKFALVLACAGLWTYSSLFAAIIYPAPPPWQPDPEQREHLRRSLTLLQSSTPAERKTVRVLFYGQSITQQAWWKEVAKYLRSTYTNATLIIENRAIGGHASQLLVKTAEADLYPFQPDLLIFHVYGSHIEYENIIRRVRERTCADILLQTDHLTSDASLTEETDPAKLSPAKWDPWMNHVFLPATAAKYGACRADIHELWKGYLKVHQLKAADLLKDSVHLNGQGEWLMAELLKAYLAPLSPKAGYDPLNEARVHTVPMPSSAGPESFRFEFAGTRADVIFKVRANAGLSVLVDGKSPSAIPELYGFTRVSAFPMSDWPVLLKVGSAAPLVAEDWSLKIDQASADGKCCHFTLRGSVTGEDGEGYSTNRFVSKSGRIVIEPGDWNLAFSVSVFKRAWPDNQTATWRAVLRGTDKALPPAAVPGTEACVTLAQGLSSGLHVLELRGASLADQIQSIRFYSPVTGTLAADSPASFRILVFSKTTGYRHASITNGIDTIRELGAQHNFAVDATEDSSAFTGTNLARYQAVVMLSVTGDVFNPEQEGVLRDYILGGGGLAAIHGAIFGPSACEEKWAWYGELFCCAFTNHSSVLPATINVEDSAHPSMRGLPLHWQRTDEWYNFSGSPRGCARVLATMDESTYGGGKMGGDHPIAWCRRLGKGRMWYTALGHTESSFSEPLFRQHLLGGIRVAAGQANAEFTPNTVTTKR